MARCLSKDIGLPFRYFFSDPAPSIKRISSSNPEGPLRDQCRRPAPPGTSGFFYPDTGHSRPPATGHVPVVSLEPPAPAHPAHSAARLATWSRQGLVLQAPRPTGPIGSPHWANRNQRKNYRGILWELLYYFSVIFPKICFLEIHCKTN